MRRVRNAVTTSLTRSREGDGDLVEGNDWSDDLIAVQSLEILIEDEDDEDEEDFANTECGPGEDLVVEKRMGSRSRIHG